VDVTLQLAVTLMSEAQDLLDLPAPLTCLARPLLTHQVLACVCVRL